ncbi:MAG: response regulator [Thermoguttaceae bacterium]
MPKLFSSFTQVDTQNTSHLNGTGLGLSICKHIVELMSGCINVTSVYGQGSTFSIIIPYIAGDAAQIKTESSSHKFIVAATARILVVDDNEINRNVATGIFGSLGVAIDTAESGMEAIEKVQSCEYDIVFMDHMMPEMDGIEATKRIRNLGNRHAEQTIIALTANAVQGARDHFLASGMNDFLSKPIDKQTLNDLLIKWLSSDCYTLGSPARKGTADDPIRIRQLQSAIDSALPEVNVVLGVSRIDGDWDTYLKSLAIFRRRLPEFQRKLSISLDEGKINDFAIDIHGMKGALAGMGCEELASQAAALERAAKDSDYDECREHFPSFIAALEILYDRLSTFFESFGNDDESVVREAGSAEFLRDQLAAILNALNDFDIDTASAALDQLLALSFSTETDEKLRKLKERLEDFDYDGAKSLCDV